MALSLMCTRVRYCPCTSAELCWQLLSLCTVLKEGFPRRERSSRGRLTRWDWFRLLFRIFEENQLTSAQLHIDFQAPRLCQRSVFRKPGAKLSASSLCSGIQDCYSPLGLPPFILSSRTVGASSDVDLAPYVESADGSAFDHTTCAVYKAAHKSAPNDSTEACTRHKTRDFKSTIPHPLT